ncbi:hypothetical protein WA026_011089, partial [Henosepilachna vigintioctopunctata]
SNHLTDENEAEENELGVVEVRGVPGQLKVHQENMNEVMLDNENPKVTASGTTKKSNKRQKLTNFEVEEM